LDAAKRERGVLRIPVLPEELRPPASAGPRPSLPILSGPVARRRRRRPRIGLGIWLGLILAGLAAGAAALVLAQPSGDHARGVRIAVVSVSSPPATKAPAPVVAKAPVGPFHVAVVREPRSVLAAVEHSAAVTLASGAAWIVGGEPRGTPVDAIERVSLPGGQVAQAGSFEEPLAESGFASEGVTLFLAGGFTGARFGTAVLRFTPPNGAAALVARLPVAVRAPAVALLDGRLYVAGGRSAAGPSRSLVAVDLQSGGVRRLAPLPHAIAGGALVPLGGKLYLLAGTTVLRIDPANGRATAAGALPAQLRGAVGLGGALVVAGGRAYRLRASS
jgi:hypothetical protein